MSSIEFNAGQKEGIERIADWFGRWKSSPASKQVFVLAGSAGTGKTSLALAAAERCAPSHRVVFIAPTGKAASRLRQKGCKGAKTLHQFIYNPRGEDEEGDPIFIEKGYLEDKPLLVVLDEGSMVGAYDFNNLKRHGIAVLVLCDMKQLQPVKAAAWLTEDHIDFELTEIMRQAGESNIIRAAGFVSQGKKLPWREYEDVRVRPGSPPIADLVEHAGDDAQILCSYNNTRVVINDAVRAALGFKGDLPQVGEKVMCWFNQHDRNFMNGEQGIVLSFEDMRPEDIEEDQADEMIWLRLRSLTDGKERRVKFNPLCFVGDSDARAEAIKAPGGFQFGYCSTTHKAQGSEWPNVLVIEELMGDYKKIMYTAFTRAQKRLTVYRKER